MVKELKALKEFSDLYPEYLKNNSYNKLQQTKRYQVLC